jgi:hypothetical protein
MSSRETPSANAAGTSGNVHPGVAAEIQVHARPLQVYRDARQNSTRQSLI